MASSTSPVLDLTHDARTIQNSFVGQSSAKSYKDCLVRIMIWLFDFHVEFISDEFIASLKVAHQEDMQSRNRKKTRTGLRQHLRTLLENVTSEGTDGHKSPIKIDGEGCITWAVTREYMTTLKKKVKVSKVLAERYAMSNTGGSKPSAVSTNSTISNEDEQIDALVLQSISSYEAVRSGLQYLHKRAGVQMTQKFEQSMAQFIAGCKRTIPKEKQELAQKITEGKEPMSVEVYEYIAKEMFESDKAEHSLFAHLFFLLDWNLMKRAENCAGCKIDHIYWNGDSLVFEFAKSKGDPDGKFVGPWHCYANPEKPHVCLVLAMAKYCLTYREVLMKNAPLFEGSHQYDRYIKLFGEFVHIYAPNLANMGVKPGDLGTHSVRKGVATMVASGCTVSPPIVSLCIRVGWVMGGVKDKYLFYEAAGDHYVGRCATTLDRLKKEFAVSPPYFDYSAIIDPLSRQEKREQVEEFLYSRLGDMNDMERTKKMMMMAFASVCFHRSYLDEHLHPQNPFRFTPMWQDLKPEVFSYARIAYPWDKTSETPAYTGIPPHVSLLAEIADMKCELKKMKERFSADINDILDDRGVGDAGFFTNKILVALDKQTATLLDQRRGENVSALAAAEKESDSNRSYVICDENEDVVVLGDVQETEAVKKIKRKQRELDTKRLVEARVQKVGLVDGRWTPLPRDFKFPRGMTMLDLIGNWYIPDSKAMTPPFCTLQPSHLATDTLRKYRRKMKAVMGLVRTNALRMNCWPGDEPKHWNRKKTSDVWNKIGNSFLLKYQTIQRGVTIDAVEGGDSSRRGDVRESERREGSRKRPAAAGGREPKRTRKNRMKTISWATIYNNCSEAGVFKSLPSTTQRRNTSTNSS